MTAPEGPVRGLIRREALCRRGDRWRREARLLPEETAVALVVQGATVAVLMATPADLEDFAHGFCLTEGLISGASDISDLTLVSHPAGIEAQIWLARAEAGAAIEARRRTMIGPVGCGLCGIESLEAALRPLPPVPEVATFAPAEVTAALDALAGAQPLHDASHAAHAAALWRPGRPVLVREDVGRHNALDKLAGALARAGIAAGDGVLAMTSRISVDLVQKAAMIGAGVIVSPSAPDRRGGRSGGGRRDHAGDAGQGRGLRPVDGPRAAAVGQGGSGGCRCRVTS